MSEIIAFCRLELYFQTVNKQNLKSPISRGTHGKVKVLYLALYSDRKDMPTLSIGLMLSEHFPIL